MNRRLMLALLLVGTLVAAWFAPPSEENAVQLSVRAKNNSRPGVSSGTPSTSTATSNTGAPRSRTANIDVLSIRRRDDGDGETNERLFASARWNQPAAVTQAVIASPQVAEPAPQAPPLPFRVLGRYDEAGQAVVFLQHQEQNLAARAGDTLVNDYKVESIHGSTMTLRYLPLNQVQTLDVGGSQ